MTILTIFLLILKVIITPPVLSTGEKGMTDLVSVITAMYIKCTTECKPGVWPKSEVDQQKTYSPSEVTEN